MASGGQPIQLLRRQEQHDEHCATTHDDFNNQCDDESNFYDDNNDTTNTVPTNYDADDDKSYKMTMGLTDATTTTAAPLTADTTPRTVSAPEDTQMTTIETESISWRRPEVYLSELPDGLASTETRGELRDCRFNGYLFSPSLGEDLPISCQTYGFV